MGELNCPERPWPCTRCSSHQKEASLSRPSPLAWECPYLPSLQSLSFPSKLGLFISLSALDTILGENDPERPAPLTSCQAQPNARGAQRVKTVRGARLVTCTSVCPPTPVPTHPREPHVYGSQPGASQILVKSLPTDARDTVHPWVRKIPPRGGSGTRPGHTHAQWGRIHLPVQ